MRPIENGLLGPSNAGCPGSRIGLLRGDHVEGREARLRGCWALTAKRRKSAREWLQVSGRIESSAGIEAARVRGRRGDRKFALTKVQVRLVQAAMKNRDTSVAALAAKLRVKPVTLYRYVRPRGELRENGKQVLNAR